MSAFNAAQKEQIAGWVNEGLSLSDVQKRITADFGVHLTYMDVRFLVDDLDLTVKSKEDPKPAEPAVAPGTTPEAAAEPAATPGAGRVSLTVNPVQAAGVLVGGSVTFSDGQTGQWQMDEQGQLGFVPPYVGYKPAPADVQQFQVELDNELRRQGY